MKLRFQPFFDKTSNLTLSIVVTYGKDSAKESARITDDQDPTEVTPKLIFADEPTGNLDRESGVAVLELMAELNHENNITMVMVTHDRDVALKADHIYELVDGRICKFIDVKKTGKIQAAKEIEERTCTVEK